MKTTLIYASVLGFLVACGGKGGGGGGPDVDTSDTEDPADFCRAAALSYCATVYDCLTEEERAGEGLPATQDACEREVNASCRQNIDNCEINEEYAYSPTMAAQCLEQMDEAACVDAGQRNLGAAACDDTCQLTRGTMSVAWTFSPMSESCGTTGVDRVRVFVDGPMRLQQDFDCYDGVAYFLEPIPTGEYTVRIALFSGAQERWQSPPKAAVLDRSHIDVTITIPVE